MSKEFTTKATFTQGARVVSEYKNDMIFYIEQVINKFKFHY